MLSSVETEEAFKMSPGWYAHAKLSVKKTVVLLGWVGPHVGILGWVGLGQKLMFYQLE